MDERQFQEECFSLRGELDHDTPTIHFIMAAVYQTAPRQAIHQSYNTVVLEAQPLRELSHRHRLTPRETLDSQQCLVLLRGQPGAARRPLTEGPELAQWPTRHNPCRRAGRSRRR
jgi:hypothetical protein